MKSAIMMAAARKKRARFEAFEFFMIDRPFKNSGEKFILRVAPDDGGLYINSTYNSIVDTGGYYCSVKKVTASGISCMTTFMGKTVRTTVKWDRLYFKEEEVTIQDQAEGRAHRTGQNPKVKEVQL